MKLDTIEIDLNLGILGMRPCTVFYIPDGHLVSVVHVVDDVVHQKLDPLLEPCDISQIEALVLKMLERRKPAHARDFFDLAKSDLEKYVKGAI